MITAAVAALVVIPALTDRRGVRDPEEHPADSR
jgi:hypothetical protein